MVSNANRRRRRRSISVADEWVFGALLLLFLSLSVVRAAIFQIDHDISHAVKICGGCFQTAHFLAVPRPKPDSLYGERNEVNVCKVIRELFELRTVLHQLKSLAVHRIT